MAVENKSYKLLVCIVSINSIVSQHSCAINSIIKNKKEKLESKHTIYDIKKDLYE